MQVQHRGRLLDCKAPMARIVVQLQVWREMLDREADVVDRTVQQHCLVDFCCMVNSNMVNCKVIMTNIIVQAL